jgi:hypothetical protein
MSTSITARDLRTLRRLARTTALFPSPSPTSFTVRFALGGESLTPRVRRRLRRSFQDLSKKLDQPATVTVSVRYGRSERQRRQLFHPHFTSVQSLLRGETIRVERCVAFFDGSSISPTSFAKLLAEIDAVLKNEGRALQNVGSQTSGPSTRFLICGVPFVSFDSSKSGNLQAIRPAQASAFLAPLPDFNRSFLATLDRATYRSLEAVTRTPHQAFGAFTSSLQSPFSTLLGLFAYRIHQLSSAKLLVPLTRWYNGCAQRLQIFGIAVRFRCESLVVGGIAQFGRAVALHAIGHRFDSDCLH